MLESGRPKELKLFSSYLGTFMQMYRKEGIRTFYKVYKVYSEGHVQQYFNLSGCIHKLLKGIEWSSCVGVLR